MLAWSFGCPSSDQFESYLFKKEIQMKKVYCFLAASLILASSVASAQCTSCAGTTPSFQPMSYAAPVYQGQFNNAPLSYSSAPVYSQPVFHQAMYAQPVYHGCCGQPMTNSCGGCAGQSYSAAVPCQSPMYYSAVSHGGGCVNCGCCNGGMVTHGGMMMDPAMPAAQMGIPVEGVMIPPAEVSTPPAADQAQPPAAVPPADSVTPPTPETIDDSAKPAPETKKDGET
jgi:hypothetical protein